MGMRWVGHAARIGEMKNEYKIVVGHAQVKRQLGKTTWMGG
jgi:hypothetical protein